MIDEQTESNRRTKKSDRGSFWKELPILLGVALLVAFLVRAFVVQTFYIPSPSMEHTLDINDRVLVNKLVYDFRSPHRGEIVVFESPMHWRSNPNEKDFIKRIIAVGGDHIKCCDSQGRLIVNGQPLDEPYIFTEAGVKDPAASEPFDVTVPAGRLWVMGDHRTASGDSLANYRKDKSDLASATIAEDKVIGRAFVLFWPFGRATWLTVPETFDSVPSPAGG